VPVESTHMSFPVQRWGVGQVCMNQPDPTRPNSWFNPFCVHLRAILTIKSRTHTHTHTLHYIISPAPEIYGSGASEQMDTGRIYRSLMHRNMCRVKYNFYRMSSRISIVDSRIDVYMLIQIKSRRRSIYFFRECCSRCRFQPHDCIIIRFVE